MATKEDLTTRLANQYGKTAEDINGSTPITDILSIEQLTEHLKDWYSLEFDNDTMIKLSNFDSLFELCNR